MLDSLQVYSRYSNFKNGCNGEKYPSTNENHTQHVWESWIPTAVCPYCLTLKNVSDQWLHQGVINPTCSLQLPAIHVKTSMWLHTGAIEYKAGSHISISDSFYLILGIILSRCVLLVMARWQFKYQKWISRWECFTRKQSFCCGLPDVSKRLSEATRGLVTISVIQDLYPDCASSVHVRNDWLLLHLPNSSSVSAEVHKAQYVSEVGHLNIMYEYGVFS